MGKKELPYFSISNNFGGNQSWFLDPWMHIGGCGALTMCDFLIYMACCKNRKECYPYDAEKLTRRDYRRFGMSMKPYLRPRESGIKDLKTFMDGAAIYMEDAEIDGITVEGFSGDRNCQEAAQVIKGSIDADMPAAMLMLKHENREFNFFEWHWFLIVGYDESPEGFRIKVATYGKAHWLPLEEFWNTGYDDRGGLVLFKQKENH